MEINESGGIQGSSPLGPSRKAQSAKPDKPDSTPGRESRPPDTVDISEEAKEAEKQIRPPDLSKVARVGKLIEEDEYITMERLDGAIENLIRSGDLWKDWGDEGASS